MSEAAVGYMQERVDKVRSFQENTVMIEELSKKEEFQGYIVGYVNGITVEVPVKPSLFTKIIDEVKESLEDELKCLNANPKKE